MGIVNEEKWIEMLEKKPDGNFIAKYPKVKSKNGITFDEHLADYATQEEPGHIKFDGLLKTGLNADMLDGKHANEFLQNSNDVYVTGTYIGNDASSRTITLGFRPKAVILYTKDNRTSGWGGMALNNFPAKNNETPIITIVSNGFTVYKGTDSSTNYGVFTNSQPFRYIAFK